MNHEKRDAVLNLAIQRCARVITVMIMLLAVASTGYAHGLGDDAKIQGYPNASLLVSGQEIDDHLGEKGVRILDVRLPEQYATGHIPGAVNLPITETTRTVNGVPAMLAPTRAVEEALGQRGVTRETRVVIYDDIGAVHAARLFWVLDYLGHPRVSVLQGGFKLWRLEGRPISLEVPRPVPARYRGELRPERSAGRSWVQAHLEDPTIVLVDARSPEEFDGTIPGRGIKRPGHIPGSANVDWIRNLTKEEPRQFKDAAKLERIYRKAGATPDKEIVVYCRTGVRAAHDYFVLRLLGHPRVRLYDGSYVEWSADAKLPVAQ